MTRRALAVIRTSLRWLRRVVFAILGAIAIGLIVANLFRAPQSDRDWDDGFERIPRVLAFDGDRITVENFRNFRWSTSSAPEARWETETFDLRELAGADFIVVPIGDWEGAAHTMLSFEFRGATSTRHAVVSMEARRERNEPYSTWRGVFNEYELAYVIGSEEDLIGLRAAVRGNELYRYRLNATPEGLRALFANMALTADELRDTPEFYGTLWNSCTTRIAMHVGAATGARIPLSWRYVLPGFSGELAYDLGFIGDAAMPFAELKESAKIGQKARDAYGLPGFSARIRD